MPKLLRSVLIILLWIILLAGGFVAFWIRDASLISPAIDETLEPQAAAH